LVAGLGVVILTYAVDSNGLLSRFVGDDPPSVFWFALPMWFLLVVAEEAISVHRTGQTGGHRVGGLRVVDHVSGGPPGWGRSTLRAFAVSALTLIPPLHLLGALWVQLSPTNRGVHDLLGRTLVVIDGTAPSQPPPPGALVAVETPAPPGLARSMAGGPPAPPGWIPPADRGSSLPPAPTVPVGARSPNRNGGYR